MTNEEINEAVARRLGWSQDHGIWERNNDPFRAALPDYCTDIKAAWEIVPKLEKFVLHYQTDRWVCTFKNGDDVESIVADTAPMVICKAFLKLDEK